MSPSPQRYRLTASNLARYFKHGCDRLFRWDAVAAPHREVPGIGADVPKRIRNQSRPGIELLMAEGDRFEQARVEGLATAYGEAAIHYNAPEEQSTGEFAPAPVRARQLRSLLSRDTPPRFIAQVELNLEREAPDAAAAFLRRFGLDPERVEVRPALPDLLEVHGHDDRGELDREGPAWADGKARLRVWDFKASPQAKHEHFAQVAYYSFLLEAILPALGLADRYAVDTAWGVIRTKEDEPVVFELEPYRRAVEDVLRKRVPGLLATPAAEAHYHVCAKCLVCEYVETCEAEADATDDLSRIPYISSDSKRRLGEAGIGTCAALAGVDPEGAAAEALRERGHDLAVNLTRYVACARALAEDEPRPLDATTLEVPAFEDIRAVVSAEQDGVTGTVFALGLKTYEGWDAEAGRVIGTEEVYVADEPDSEARILSAFLRDVNGLFERVHAHNQAIDEALTPEEEAYQTACEAYDAARASERDYKAQKPPRLSRKNPEHARFYAWRDQVATEKREARERRDALKDAANLGWWARRQRQRSLHIYAYDGLDLAALKGALERHLGQRDTDDERALQREIVKLVRLFPPDSVLPDADTFRSVPGTVAADAMRRLVALPAPYLYDLKTVSALYRPHNADGEESGTRYLPRYGFGWAHSNQVAFERIHDVWKGRGFEAGERTYTAAEVLDQIRATVRGKLGATDSVVRRLKQDHKATRATEIAALQAAGVPPGEAKREARGVLLLRKQPFRLYTGFDPTDFDDLEALQTFALLEAALGELQKRHLHALKPTERAAKFECIRGLRYLPGADEDDGRVLWFTFAEDSRDAKFREGQGFLAVTPEDEPDALLRTVDGPLFAEWAGWRGQHYKVTLERIDLDAAPPRIALRPDKAEKFRDVLDLPGGDREGGRTDRTFVLDEPHTDPLTARLMDTLAWLRTGPESGAHVADLLRTGTIQGHRPFLRNVHRAQHALRRRMAAAGKSDDLDDRSWDILRAITQEALSLVWGPPGTGKTYLAARLLALYAEAAAGGHAGQPLRVFVTASTHHAVVNVLRELRSVADAYGLGPDALGLCKLGRENEADAEVPDLERVQPRDLGGLVGGDPRPCVVVGGTVWSLYKALKVGEDFAGAPLFDVVLVDEASQMTVPQALLAFCAAKPDANLVLTGDDKQLPPIVHGSYPEEHKRLLSSVFAFARHHAEDQGRESRVLHQLTRNYRMNEPLTAYPRAVIYGTYEAHFPDQRAALEPPATGEALLTHLLRPDRAAVLARYRPPRSYTARNDLEAALAAEMVAWLAARLIDPETGAPYTPAAFAARGVAVLAPHRAQNAAIRHTLRGYGFDDTGRGSGPPMVLVDTVEKLQGKQRQVIVVSYGVADAEYADAEADFLLSQARFNVAATRAERKLVVLCSDPVLDAVPSDRAVLMEAVMLKEFRDYCDDGSLTLPWSFGGDGDAGQAVDLHLHWKGFAA